MATDLPPPDDERDETRLERLDRNTVELLNELRVVGAGLQVLFGFLLVVPFNARFALLTGFERGLYIVALGCVATSMVVLIAPTVQHRLLFHLGQKAFLVHTATRLMVIACVFLGVALADIVLLVVTIVIGLAPAVVLTALMVVLIGGLWFAVPLLRRRNLPEQR